MSEQKINLEDVALFQKEMQLQVFKNAANDVLDRGTKYGRKDIEHITKHLIKGRNKYIKAVDTKDKKAKQLVMQQLPAMEKNWKNVLEFRKGIAILAQDQGRGITENFKTSTQGADIAGILTGNNTPMENEDGVMGYEITNPTTGNRKFMSMRNIMMMVKSNSFDKNSQKVIRAMGSNMLELSGQEGADDFNYNQVYQKVKSTIIDAGNIRSLTYDKHLDDSFHGNLVKTVKAMSYKNIGLDNEDGLSDEDAKQVVDTMLMDRETHMNYLTEYYTKFMERNWVTKKDKTKNKNRNQKGQIVDGRYTPSA